MPSVRASRADHIEVIEGVSMSDPMTAGSVSVTFAHPAAAFLYNATKPRLRVDGVEVPVPDWGTHRFPVVPGRHQLQVWVPYALPRRVGKASTEIDVRPGEDVGLEYMAPTVTFASGSLGAPGQQKSAGFSVVMALNVVAVLVVLIALVALVLA